MKTQQMTGADATSEMLFALAAEAATAGDEATVDLCNVAAYGDEVECLEAYEAIAKILNNAKAQQ